MTKEQIVVSLDLAKRLKELGAKQESLFYWVISLTTNYHVSYTEGDKSLLPQDRNDFYSAFTVSELGEMLPAYIQDGEQYGLEIQKSPNFYLAQYYDNYNKHSLVSRSAKRFADVLATILIYLIENKLIMI